MNAFAAGPFLQLAWSAPALGRSLVQVRGFASLVEYNDRSFQDGVEHYDENLRQQPASAAVDFIRPFGAGWRVRASYEMTHPGLSRGPDTAPEFRTPADPFVHAARLTLEGEVARWTLTAWASAALRDTWTDWGYPGNPDSRPDARGYERGGVGAARSFVLGRRVAARVDVAGMAGRGLDRFSRFTFDGLENRLHGSPSAAVRFDRGVVLRSALSATATRAVRGGLFVDLAVVHDPAQGSGYRHLSRPGRRGRAAPSVVDPSLRRVGLRPRGARPGRAARRPRRSASPPTRSCDEIGQGGRPMRHSLLGALATASLCAIPAAAERPVKVIDLGHPLSDADPTWTGKKAFSRTETSTFEKDGAALGKFSTDEHFGTHLDAPAHFGGSWTTDKIPVDRLVRPAVCINIAAKAAVDEDYRLASEDIRAFESRPDPFRRVLWCSSPRDGIAGGRNPAGT